MCYWIGTPKGKNWCLKYTGKKITIIIQILRIFPVSQNKMVTVNNYNTKKCQTMKIQSTSVQNTPSCLHRTNWTDTFWWWWWWWWRWWRWWWWWWWPYLTTRLQIHKTNYRDCTKITTLCDFNLPPRCKWSICSSENIV